MKALRRYAIPAILFVSLIAALVTIDAVSAQDIPVYNRSAFPHWQTRQCRPANHAALIRWSRSPVAWWGERQCRVTGGLWGGIYGDETFEESRMIDVDHVVTLSWAWRHGAWEWTRDERRVFANDPANLIPVYLRWNRSKGARPPWEWLPPKAEFHCEYLLRWKFVSDKYELENPSELASLIDEKCFRLN